MERICFFVETTFCQIDFIDSNENILQTNIYTTTVKHEGIDQDVETTVYTPSKFNLNELKVNDYIYERINSDMIVKPTEKEIKYFNPETPDIAGITITEQTQLKAGWYIGYQIEQTDGNLTIKRIINAGGKKYKAYYSNNNTNKLEYLIEVDNDTANVETTIITQDSNLYILKASREVITTKVNARNIEVNITAVSGDVTKTFVRTIQNIMVDVAENINNTIYAGSEIVKNSIVNPYKQAMNNYYDLFQMFDYILIYRIVSLFYSYFHFQDKFLRNFQQMACNCFDYYANQ